MKKRYILIVIIVLLIGATIIYNNVNNKTEKITSTSTSTSTSTNKYKNEFEIDKTVTVNNKEIHHTRYIPKNINSLKNVDMYITLPGWEGLYFQGSGANLVEDFYWRARELNPNLIILAPQLDDWGETSANDTIALTKYYKERYNVRNIYINGLSGGGETLSLVLNKEPQLYKKALMVSSKYNGSVDKVVNSKTPIYFFTGENDSYYGSENFKETYRKIYNAYEKLNLSKEEIDKLVILDIREHEYFTKNGFNDEHMGANLASKEDKIMKWVLDIK